jgi:hypothetical protein
VGTSLTGPWVVATSVPAVICSIPPGSPVHYVTYVRVYDWTAQVVYVGYTPGYFGTYVVVYGTGYSYSPWVGTVWYGAPVTYGVAAALTYTPWIGWAVGFGFGWARGATTSSWASGPTPGGVRCTARPGDRLALRRGDRVAGRPRPGTCITTGARRPPSHARQPASTPGRGTSGPTTGGRRTTRGPARWRPASGRPSATSTPATTPMAAAARRSTPGPGRRRRGAGSRWGTRTRASRRPRPGRRSTTPAPGRPRPGTSATPATISTRATTATCTSAT